MANLIPTVWCIILFGALGANTHIVHLWHTNQHDLQLSKRTLKINPPLYHSIMQSHLINLTFYLYTNSIEWIEMHLLVHSGFQFRSRQLSFQFKVCCTIKIHCVFNCDTSNKHYVSLSANIKISVTRQICWLVPVIMGRKRL